MKRVGVGLIMIGIAACGISRSAKAYDMREFLHEAAVLAQSLIEPSSGDREIIEPPAGTDPRMALIPPGSGEIRTIVPPYRFRQR